MGMFNYLKCNRVMPDGVNGKEHEFQTKDFECSMVEYEISDDGRMLQPIWHSEEVPKEKRPYPNDDGFLGLCGSMKTVVEKMHDMNFHGIVYFYTSTGPNHDWHSYNAKFTEGQLVEIRCANATS